MIYLDACRGLNHIGRLGENEHRVILFRESAEVLAMYPEASVTVLHRRPGDPAAYPVAPGYVSIEGGIVHWKIQSGDLERVGRGRAEVVFTQGDVVAKSLIYDTMIDQALDGSGNPPEPWESWIDEVTAAGEHAPQIIDGEWWAWSVADEEYINTHVPATGPEGNGIRSVQLNQDYTLTIAFTNGSSYTTSSIRGEPGADYVISQADYAAIAAIVMADAGFQEKVNAAEAAADLACELATGEHLDGTPSSTHNENNAHYWSEQAQQTKEDVDDIVEGIAQEDTAQDIKDEILGIGDDVEEILNIQRSIRYYSELPVQGTDGYVYITPDGIFYYNGTEDEYQQISGNDSLNGFSFAKNNSNQVVMTYTNPEDETDTAEAVMPTNTTLQAVLTEMQGITADLMLIAGGNT